MKKNKIIILQLLMVLIVISLCSCGNKKRKEAERIAFTLAVQDYLMQEYGIEAYEVDYIREKDWGSDYETLVMKDNNGISFYVSANAKSKSYEFYDDYVDACAAAEIEQKIAINVPYGNARIYVNLKNTDIENINVEAENVSSLHFIAIIENVPNESTLERLYEIYEEIDQLGYEWIFFDVGFTDGNEIFDKVVENYNVYGYETLQYHGDEMYAELIVKEKNSPSKNLKIV